MRKTIAIPLSNGGLSHHFGRCDKFVLYTVADGKIIGRELYEPPTHQTGSHPEFLRNKGCSTVIASGMGIKAQNLFLSYGIEVLIGVESADSEEIIKNYLHDSLKTNQNRCEHKKVY